MSVIIGFKYEKGRKNSLEFVVSVKYLFPSRSFLAALATERKRQGGMRLGYIITFFFSSLLPAVVHMSKSISFCLLTWMLYSWKKRPIYKKIDFFCNILR